MIVAAAAVNEAAAAALSLELKKKVIQTVVTSKDPRRTNTQAQQCRQGQQVPGVPLGGTSEHRTCPQVP